MNKQIYIQANQTLFDISIQEFGSIEGVFYILDVNPGLTIESNLVNGETILIPNRESLNKKVVDYYDSLKIKATSGSFSFTTNASKVIVRNTTNTYNLEAESGETVIVPNITHTDSDLTQVTLPAQTPMVCSPAASMNVNFNSDVTEVALSEPVIFTDLTSPLPEFWDWRFEGGGRSELKNPTYSFDTVGLKTVTLIAANSTTGGYKTKTNYINVFITKLLDSVKNAKAAYSLRLLRNLYNGNCIRVRRSSDNTELDIPFNGEEVDSVALLSFVGNNDGFVTVWYDQSVNNLDLAQSNFTSQPKIVSQGVLITENGKPAIEYNNDYLFNNTALSISNYLVSFVLKVTSGNSSNPRYLALNGGSSNVQMGYNSAGSYFTRKGNQTNITTQQFNTLGSLDLLVHSSDNNIDKFNINGVEETFNGIGAPTANSLMGDGIHLFKGYQETSFFVNTGLIQELVIYDTDKTSEKEVVINNVNAFYNIY